MLGRARRLTPGGLRAAIAQAVMDVAPGKARKRREAAKKDARVQRWAEDSGNAALMGRELPPAEVLAADQRITAWAHELRAAGLEGSMDELRARAYLDLLLDKDSRPTAGPGLRSRPQRVTAGRRADGGRGMGGRRWSGGLGRPGPVVREPGGAGRVRGAGDVDGPAGDAGGSGGPARGTGRDRSHRPVAGPGPGRSGRPEPQHDVVRDGDRRAGTRGGAWVRPARAQGPRGPGNTGSEGNTRTGPGRARDGPGFSFTAEGRDGAAGRVWHLAAAYTRGRAGPDRRTRSPRH